MKSVVVLIVVVCMAAGQVEQCKFDRVCKHGRVKTLDVMSVERHEICECHDGA